MIFKVQRPLATNDKNLNMAQRVLVYNKDRSILFEYDMPPEIMQTIFKNESMKEYVEARHVEEPNIQGHHEPRLKVIKRVHPQNW